jgi:hypothetical protein
VSLATDVVGVLVVQAVRITSDDSNVGNPVHLRAAIQVRRIRRDTDIGIAWIASYDSLRLGFRCARRARTLGGAGFQSIIWVEGICYRRTR